MTVRAMNMASLSHSPQWVLDLSGSSAEFRYECRECKKVFLRKGYEWTYEAGESLRSLNWIVNELSRSEFLPGGECGGEA